MNLYEEFRKYGWADITCSYYAYGLLAETEVRIAFDVSGLVSPNTTPSQVRTAMYAMAEEAIAYAETEYKLIAAPRLDIDGQMHRHLGIEPVVVTSGILTLRIMER